jgi:hypothetical protein
MYIVRDIFQLKFGHYRDVKALLDEAMSKGMFSPDRRPRALSDFTGDAYRLVLEQGFETLADFEKTLSGDFQKEEWQQWYVRFKEHVVSSSREIMKQVM